MTADDLMAEIKELDLLERNGAWVKHLGPLLARKLKEEQVARNNVAAPGGAAERETHLHSYLLAEELAGWVQDRRAKLEADLKEKRIQDDQ